MTLTDLRHEDVGHKFRAVPPRHGVPVESAHWRPVLSQPFASGNAGMPPVFHFYALGPACLRVAFGNMRVSLSNLSLENARIVRVIEDVDSRRMAFDVSYPIPDGGSDFPQRRFIFPCCRRYLVEEGRGGEPVIHRVEISKLDPHIVAIHIHTDLGVRELVCSPDVLEETA